MAIWTQLAIAVAILSLYRRLRTQRLRDHNSPELEELQQLAGTLPRLFEEQTRLWYNELRWLGYVHGRRWGCQQY